MNKLLNSLLLLTLFSFSMTAFANKDFPGRTKFPNIRVLEKSELAARFNNVVIVDARSSYEYETLRIKGAVNIPVSAKSFAKDVKLLRQQTPKDIVFYCNGRTCMKSYKATKAAMRAGIDRVFAYDAGMFEWVQQYPEKSELLGQSPVDPTRIISNQQYKAHLLSPQQFSDQIYNLGSRGYIIDIRDSYQRAASITLFLGIEQWASLENRNKIQEYISKAVKENAPIYVYDEVGKQVRWLQYALEAAGLKEYYFLEKGAHGFIDTFMTKR